MSDCDIKSGVNLFLIMLLIIITFLNGCEIEYNKERIKALEQRSEAHECCIGTR